MILPTAEVVDITLSTVTGHVLQNDTFSALQAGLNTLQMDVSRFPVGVYLLTIRYQGRRNTCRLVINP